MSKVSQNRIGKLNYHCWDLTYKNPEIYQWLFEE